MRKLAILSSLLFVMVGASGLVTATHEDGRCTVESADPDTYIMVEDLYVEDRDGAGVPGSGLLLGSGTWVYEESNGVPGLQRGGDAPTGGDSVADENCGHGPDTLIL